MNETRTKIEYIQVLRTLAAFLVIALHCISPYLMAAQIYGTRTWLVCDAVNGVVRSGVPLFFMVGGYLALSSPATRDVGSFYRKRAKKILPPLLAWNIIYYAASCVTNGQAPVLKDFVAKLMVNGTEYHLWYLYQIIGLYLLAPFLKCVLDACDEREQNIFFLVALLGPSIMPFFNIVTGLYLAPFGPLLEGYCGFFLYGYLLGTRNLTPRRRGIIYCLGVVGYLINVLSAYFASSEAGIKLTFNIGYSLVHYMTAGALFVLVKTLVDQGGGGIVRQGILAFCRYVADLSFSIYLLHVLVLNYVDRFLSAIPDITPVPLIVGDFLLTSVLCILLAAGFSHCKTLLQRERAQR